MDITQINKEIKQLIRKYGFRNLYFRIEPFGDNGDVYFRMSKSTRLSPKSRGIGKNSPHFDGLRTVEQIASFCMVNARIATGRSLFRANYFKIWEDRKRGKCLKFIDNHEVKQVHFEEVIAR